MNIQHITCIYIQVYEVHASFLQSMSLRHILLMTNSCKEKVKHQVAPCIIEVTSSCDLKVRHIILKILLYHTNFVIDKQATIDKFYNFSLFIGKRYIYIHLSSEITICILYSFVLVSQADPGFWKRGGTLKEKRGRTYGIS